MRVVDILARGRRDDVSGGGRRVGAAREGRCMVGEGRRGRVTRGDG